jgi:hypothetical protein
MLHYVSPNMADGKIAAAAYVSPLFALVVAISGLRSPETSWTSRKKYVIEEGIFAA